MTQTVEIPVWVLLMYVFGGIFLMVLDGWRAKAWTRYIEQVNKLAEKNIGS